jgi:site-specific recombinase XerD
LDGARCGFTRRDGRPLDPRADWQEFKQLLAEVGIDDRRLYNGSRHTAGTILNELGGDLMTIIEILRQSQVTQTRRYVKGQSQLSKEGIRRMGDAFIPQSGPATETPDSRAARARRRRRVH